MTRPEIPHKKWSNRTPSDRANLDAAVVQLLDDKGATRGVVHQRFLKKYARSKHEAEYAPDERAITHSLKRLVRDGKAETFGENPKAPFYRCAAASPATDETKPASLATAPTT
jgi:hypothetical protein